MTTAAVLERHTDAITQACARPDGLTLFESASTHLRQIVGFDGACWLGTDPAILLPIAPVLIENVEAMPNGCELYWDREFLVEDVMLYRTLARSARPAATLYATTDGNPARSARSPSLPRSRPTPRDPAPPSTTRPVGCARWTSGPSDGSRR